MILFWATLPSVSMWSSTSRNISPWTTQKTLPLWPIGLLTRPQLEAIIQIVSRIKKHSNSLIKEKEWELTDLLAQHKQRPDLDLRDKIDSTRLELNLCLTTKAEKSLRWTQASFYMLKDNPGTMLASRLTPRIRRTVPPKLRQPNGNLTQNPQIITKLFHSYYTSLYSAQGPPSRSSGWLF